MKKINGLSIDELKEIFSSVEELIVVTDKVTSGFDNHTKMALAILLFFSESNILDRLSKVRRIINAELESKLSGAEYDEWIETEVSCWDPPYNKTEEDLLEMQDENLLWTKYP
ncbi:Uncharacterised protein [Yersinia nurmii]|uniref:Uncharacterized protein n=1 Tax=Yersinia nurmii TaxID=685706 RepID=A0ABP1Y8B7_9GAMM|nr:hypothetical protein [Yersinia nurmii]CND85361.1 Uncharacterised protein [Yersinia nurmii]